MKASKQETASARCIWRLKTAFNLEIRQLEIKQRDAKCDWFVSRLKCNNKYARIAFRDRNSQSKMRLRYFDVLKHQEGLNDIKKGTNDNFRGCKALSKVKPMYLEVTLKESMFD